MKSSLARLVYDHTIARGMVGLASYDASTRDRWWRRGEQVASVVRRLYPNTGIKELLRGEVNDAWHRAWAELDLRSSKINRLRARDAFLAKAGHCLYDTDVSRGGEVRFFSVASEFHDMRRKTLDHTNMVGSGGCLPMGYKKVVNYVSIEPNKEAVSPLSVYIVAGGHSCRSEILPAGGGIRQLSAPIEFDNLVLMEVYVRGWSLETGKPQPIPDGIEFRCELWGPYTEPKA